MEGSAPGGLLYGQIDRALGYVMLYGPGIELHWTERRYIEDDIDTLHRDPYFPGDPEWLPHLQSH